MEKKTVIVTGASGGIGYQLVKDYHSAGYAVIAIDIKETQSFPDAVKFIKCDLSKECEIHGLCEFLEQNYSGVHVLINNAAVAHFLKPMGAITFEDWDKLMGVNLRAAFFLSQSFVKLNKGAPYGRIINIASTRHDQNEPDWDLYGTSKGGLIGMTNSMCVSLSGTAITVNAISPGWIKTEHYEHLSLEDHKQHPSGRVGTPKDISRACLFLSDENNDFINGINLYVDGGMRKKMIYI